MKREFRPSKPGEWHPTREFMRFIEQHAATIRQSAKVAPLDKLDPYALAKERGIQVLTFEELTMVTSEDRLRLANLDPKAWSGGGLIFPDGQLVVLLHPQQTPERAGVTLMEEICHAYFGHKPSRLVKQPNGITKREWNEQAELEAYWTAGATLLPSEAVAKGVWRGLSAEELAAEYGASVELTVMRIKTLNLWDEYVGQRRQAS